MTTRITVGELVARFLEHAGVRAAFGVISIHNMPMLDAFNARGRVRFVSARGEAGACNMADSHARVSGTLGVCVTSTGTGAGNAAGALVEAMTAGTPMLHLTGQIDSPYLDRDLGFIHEAPAQVAMLAAAGKAAFRIRNSETALATLRQAVLLAMTPPCGPVSVEIPIDIQQSLMDLPDDLSPVWPAPVQPSAAALDALAALLAGAKRPLLWLGGGARGARAAVERLVRLGFGVVTSTQGRGTLPDDHPASLGAFNAQKPVEAFYATCDTMLVVGSRLRSNETLGYHLHLPAALHRIDANLLAQNRAYASQCFVHGDALLALNGLADRLEGRTAFDPALHADLRRARAEAEQLVDATLGPYVRLKDELNTQLKGGALWVRDITLSNSMWGNRSLVINDPRAGVHALGGGIGQGLAMGIGAAIADTLFQLGRKTVTLAGDGGLMLNIGELACAAQERADMVLLVMNDRGYGVIKNIQDVHYGERRCYADLHTPDFAKLCESLRVPHLLLAKPDDTARVLAQALAMVGPVMVEVDMASWGPFAVKFAGPPKKTA
jgi:acetolactate synthase I/II/III large subunit